MTAAIFVLGAARGADFATAVLALARLAADALVAGFGAALLVLAAAGFVGIYALPLALDLKRH